MQHGVTESKRIIKSALYALFSVNPVDDYKKIIDIFRPFKVISFDIFDTLLKRDVRSPSDVFLLAQRIYESRFGDLGFCLREARLRGEILAYRESEGREVSLPAIYSHVTGDSLLRARLIDSEVESEKKLAVSNEPVKRLFDRALAMGKKVVLVSDMYLDREVIEVLLKKAGYAGYADLFVSSEVGKRKQTGDLFPYVCEQCGVHPREVVHIGDSVRGDYFSPTRAGMRAILIPRGAYQRQRGGSDRFSSGDELSASIISATISNLSNGSPYYRRFGVEALGPLLFGLAKFVHEAKEEEKADKLFFLARDGYVLKKAYDRMFPSERGSSVYLYASRKSIGIPSVYSRDDLLDIAPSARHIRALDFLAALGIRGKSARKILRDAGYSIESYISKSRDAKDPSFQKMLDASFAEMQGEILVEREASRGYLSQEGVSGRVIVFDLGWAGNIQGFMQRLVRREIDPDFQPVGAFLGFDESRVRKDIRFKSFLGSEHPTLFLGLVETCFSAPEGTVASFARTDSGEYRARCADYEYRGRREAGAVASIQEGALDLIDRLLRYDGMVEYNFSPNEFFFGLRHVGLHPAKEDLEAFSDFCFEDNGVYSPMASPAPLMSYALGRRNITHDFSESKWKVAFLRRLLKVPLPYAGLLKVLKRLDSRKRRRARA